MLKNSLYLRKQKRRLKILAIKYRYLCLIALIAVFAVSAAMIRDKSNDGTGIINEGNAIHAIRSVETSESVYAVTFDIYGDEDEKDIDLTVEVLTGLKVRAAVFASSGWLCENRGKIKEMLENGFEIGLLLSADDWNDSPEEITLSIAKENEKYYRATGKYPRYVRAGQGRSERLAAALRTFRLYDVSYSLETEPSGNRAAENGDICCLGKICSATPYIAARFIGNMMSAGMTASSLSDLLYDFENETDAFGVQRK